MDCSLSGSSVPGILQDKNALQGILPTQGLDPQHLQRRWILYHWATWEAWINYTSIKKKKKLQGKF